MNYSLEQELLKAAKNLNAVLTAIINLIEKKGGDDEKKDS